MAGDATTARWHQSPLEDLLEAVPDATILVDFNGHIAFLNQSAERLFGYERSELVGEPVEVLVPEELRARHSAHRDAYAAQLTTRPMGIGLELAGRHRNGQPIPVDISLSYVDTEAGRYVAAAVRDISGRKRIEQALRQKNDELEKVISAKDRFLANMSHELRTPLNAILGYSGTLLMRLPGPLTEEQERQVRAMNASADRLLAVINDLLDLAKLESGKVEIVRTPVDCRAVTIEVAAAFRPEAEAKGLTMTVDAPEGPVTALADHGILSLVVRELAGNAVRFTEKGGVRLGLRQGHEGGRPAVTIDIADTGPGIADCESRLSAAFPFAGTTSDRLEGAGLGLHISRRRVEVLGGSLRCRSTVGEGTTFTVELEGC
jgi:PAS domain S-box-containing protein